VALERPKGSLVVGEPIEEPEEGGGAGNVDVAQDEVFQSGKRSEEKSGRLLLT